MNSYIALILGAFVGASLRYLIGTLSLSLSGISLSTIIVNILGSFLAGLFLNKFQGSAYIFLYIGLFGSFTTLSSFNIELFNLLTSSLYFKSLIFFSLNIIISFMFFILGYYLINKV